MLGAEVIHKMTEPGAVHQELTTEGRWPRHKELTGDTRHGAVIQEQGR